MSLDPIQLAARDQFQRQSRNYARGHILENTADVAEALDGIPFPTGSRALDVATGAGHTAFFLASAGLDVTATDLSSAMLDRVREGAAERGLAIHTALHPAEQLPYPDATFLIVSSRVAPHHFSSPSDFVRESARVLLPGGWLLVIDCSVPDDFPEAQSWLHQVEKLRDPSHNRLLPPAEWRALCQQSHLAILKSEVALRKQPDLDWYFNAANTSPQNRAAVLALIHSAPPAVRAHYQLAQEDGKIVWWWPMHTLLARKPE